MKRVIVVIALVLAVSGGAVAYWLQDRHGIKRDIRGSFKDPDSVIFGRESVYGDKACVEVDAKNSWGAYTVPKTYYVVKIGGEWSVIDPLPFLACLELASGIKLDLDEETRKTLIRGDL